jgi:hypothetical protein
MTQRVQALLIITKVYPPSVTLTKFAGSGSVADPKLEVGPARRQSIDGLHPIGHPDEHSYCNMSAVGKDGSLCLYNRAPGA